MTSCSCTRSPSSQTTRPSSLPSFSTAATSAGASAGRSKVAHQKISQTDGGFTGTLDVRAHFGDACSSFVAHPAVSTPTPPPTATATAAPT